MPRAITMALSRRVFLSAAAGAPLIAMGAGKRPPMAAVDLKSITADAKPISGDERRARIARVQTLMSERKIAALLVEPGSTLDYFTGIRWRRSERITLAIIPARGEVLVVTPAFEEPSVRETLQVGGDVRPWNEHESPIERIVQGLRDRDAASGVLAVESTTRFFIVDGLRQASNAYELISADPLVRACRLVKSPAELALMQAANNVTLEALRFVHANVERGMNSASISALMDRATVSLGGSPEFALVLLNEASAYPHGSLQVQEVREGSTVLMDCGCTGSLSKPPRSASPSAGSTMPCEATTRARAGVRATSCRDSRIAPDTASASMYMSPPTSCTAIRVRCRPECVFQTSRESTSPVSSVFVWKTVGS